MSKDGRYGGHAELHSFSDLFPNSHFEYTYSETIDTATDIVQVITSIIYYSRVTRINGITMSCKL